MEAISLHGYSVDQTTSTKKSSNPNNNPFILSRQYVNHILPPSSQYFHNMGILQLPHDNTIQLSRSSYPPPYSAQLPPLLPLPTTAHSHGAAATINRGLSFPPTPHRKPSKSKKKPKSPTKKDHIKSRTTNSAKKLIMNNNNSPLKHDPLLETKASTTGNCGNKSQNTGSVRVKVDDDRDGNVIFSGAVAFAISPPPSSLPLPTFSLRPKSSCKADASCGIDNGASSDDLRRLLRLR